MHRYALGIAMMGIVCPVRVFSAEPLDLKERERQRYFTAIERGLLRCTEKIRDKEAFLKEKTTVIEELKKAHQAGFLLIEVAQDFPCWAWYAWKSFKVEK
mgnify:FL=1